MDQFIMLMIDCAIVIMMQYSTHVSSAFLKLVENWQFGLPDDGTVALLAVNVAAGIDQGDQSILKQKYHHLFDYF